MTTYAHNSLVDLEACKRGELQIIRLSRVSNQFQFITRDENGSIWSKETRTLNPSIESEWEAISAINRWLDHGDGS